MEDDTPFLSSSSLRARDDVFCHETARRAVARAALHLGIESMSVEAADSMAGILIAYLERIGKAMATTVEASGRSTAHVNVLDALRAIEVCTEPAVAAVFPDNAAAPQAPEAGQTDTERFNHLEQMSWKGLATFCFGKQWRQATKQSATEAAAAAPRGRGGKGIGGEDNTAVSADESKNEADGGTAATGTMAGWRAPYPEEVVPFPVASPSVANPHNLPEDLLQAKEIPDKLYTIKDEEEKKRPRDESTSDEEPPAKKAKTNNDEADAKPAGTDKKKKEADATSAAPAPAEPEAAVAAMLVEEDKHRPWYFPTHWPSFPRKEVGTQALVLEDDPLAEVGDDEIDNILGEIEGRPPTSKAAEAEVDPTRSVRSALVQMNWGTMRESTGQDPYGLRVAAGAKLDGDAGGANPQIVPLAKASSAHVNRVLEGSVESSI